VKFFLLDDPARPANFARYSHVGTWAEDFVCDACGEPTSRLVEPLQIEWDNGTDRIGDFSWCGYEAVVVDAVRAFLEGNAFEARFGAVEVIQPTGRAVRKRVAFPYRGPHLTWLMPTVRLPIDESKSGVHLKSDCSICTQRRYTFKREGLVVAQDVWRGEKLFRVQQFRRSSATFISEEGLSLLESKKFLNLCPRPAGHIEA
jgi:hypothetical protein